MEKYKVNEVNQFKFLQIPKELFINECYRCKLNSDAKLIYGLLLDRMHLSEKNNWCNDNGEIYLLYTKENVAEMLGISPRTVYKAFKALEECELIYQERQGLNMPNKIYIGKFKHEFSRICKICSSRCADNAGQNMQNVQTNNTESNNTDNNNTKRLHHLNELNDDYVLSYLNIMHQCGCKHKRVTTENLLYIENSISEIKSIVDIEEWQEAVRDHFDTLSKRNDGDIMAFLKASKRYFNLEV